MDEDTIRELRAMADKFDQEAAARPADEAFEDSSSIAIGYQWAASDLRERAAELEANRDL